MQVPWYEVYSARLIEYAMDSMCLHEFVSKQYTAAAKQSALENTSKALSSLAEVFKKDTKLPTILSAPSLTPNDKSQIVQELQKHTGGADKGDTVKNFLKTLADNNRLGILEGVCEKFTVLMGASRGELDMVVTSAAVSHEYSLSHRECLPIPVQRLDAKTLQRLEAAVSKSEYSQGKKLKVVPKVCTSSHPS